MTNVIPNPDGSENVWTAFSHSGNERNRLFLNKGGEGFLNASGVSGANSDLDGRSWVIWDFNRDGKPDIAVVNANERLLQVFENQAPGGGEFIAIQLEGGGGATGVNRDAIGAVVTIKNEKFTLTRVLSMGEGFAAQNSKTLVVGVGESPGSSTVIVEWPGGRKTTLEGVKAGALGRIHEGSGKIQVSKY